MTTATRAPLKYPNYYCYYYYYYYYYSDEKVPTGKSVVYSSRLQLAFLSLLVVMPVQEGNVTAADHLLIARGLLVVQVTGDAGDLYQYRRGIGRGILKPGNS